MWMPYRNDAGSVSGHLFRWQPPMFKFGLTITLAYATLSLGCVNSRGLHPQQVARDPSSLSSAARLKELQVTDGPWPAEDWWTGIGDPQLSALIARALANNPSIAIAEGRLREAEAQIGRANAARGPEIEVAAQAAGMHLPVTLPPPVGVGHYVLEKHFDGGLRWDLDLWGGKRAAWEAALGRTQVVEAERQATRIALSVNVARLYVQLGHAFATRDVAGEELDRAIQSQNLTRQRVRAGIDGDTQLRQIDGEVASDRERVTAADRDIDAKRSALTVLVAEGPDRGLAISRPHALTPLDIQVPSTLSIELISHRADLMAARWEVEASSKDIDEAKAAFLPNVSLDMLAGFVALGGTSVFQMPARFYQVAPAFNLPIYDGGRRRAELSSRDARYDIAVAQYNAALIRSINEVTDQLSALRSLNMQVDQQEEAYSAASDAWRLSEQRYRSGVGSFLEALIVRQQLLTAERHREDLLAQQVDDSILLIQALGGGYRPSPRGSDATADFQGKP